VSAGIVISLADPHLPAVRRLIEEADAYARTLYPPESNHLLDVDALRQKQMRFFAASVDGEVLGCGGCWLHADCAEIKRLYVSPKARRLGLARRLMQAIESEAVAHGQAIARLETGTRQPEALGLYGALGYRVRGPFAAYTEDPNSVFMEKPLA